MKQDNEEFVLMAADINHAVISQTLSGCIVR